MPRTDHAPVTGEQIAQQKDSCDEVPESSTDLIGVEPQNSRSDTSDAAAPESSHPVPKPYDPLALARLDLKVREALYWHSPSPEAKDRLLEWFGPVGSLGLRSFDRDGRVREGAVQQLAQMRDGSELPFLLIRLNDWVLQVRRKARQAVDRRIHPGYAAHFLHCLPLVYRLREQSRDDHSEVVGAVAELLRSSECRPVLLRGLHSVSRATRRFSFRLLLEAPADDLLEVLEDVLASEDAVLRLWAARELRKRLTATSLAAVLERLAGDRFMPVRREALYGFAEQPPELAQSRLRPALLDPHRSMRETARFYLSRIGQQDFAQFYRDRFEGADEGELSLLIAGLGETGIAPDAARIAPLLAHSSIRVRRAAVRAIGRLAADEFGEQMLASLDDEAPSVSRAARNVLLVHPELAPARRLRQILEAAGQPHVQRFCLSLIGQLRWWDGASLLMKATGSSDEQVKADAFAYLNRWRANPNRLLSRPTHEQLQQVEEAMERYDRTFEKHLRDDLRSLVAYARRIDR